MNPNDRTPNSPGGNPGSSDPRRRPSPPDSFEDDADIDDYDISEDAPPSSAGRRASTQEVDEDEAFFEDKPGAAEANDSASRRSETAGNYGTRGGGAAPGPRNFLEQLEAGLRSAGNTATRYTRIGVARAEMEKLRFDLKAAHALLGELAMRCWSDAPDLGLTSQDPAVSDAVKKVKQLRLKIREKQAKIAELKKEN